MVHDSTDLEPQCRFQVIMRISRAGASAAHESIWENGRCQKEMPYLLGSQFIDTSYAYVRILSYSVHRSGPLMCMPSNEPSFLDFHLGSNHQTHLYNFVDFSDSSLCKTFLYIIYFLFHSSVSGNGRGRAAKSPAASRRPAEVTIAEGAQVALSPNLVQVSRPIPLPVWSGTNLKYFRHDCEVPHLCEIQLPKAEDSFSKPSEGFYDFFAD
ncbi:nodal [Striga asiatica]|uniref:Nodal n=1 Tax=Striga asiatica TaxID=4170 RepID=A0A5A7NZ27_STRAF|nr:nodal [Striga asiatica]